MVLIEKAKRSLRDINDDIAEDNSAIVGTSTSNSRSGTHCAARAAPTSMTNRFGALAPTHEPLPSMRRPT